MDHHDDDDGDHNGDDFVHEMSTERKCAAAALRSEIPVASSATVLAGSDIHRLISTLYVQKLGSCVVLMTSALCYLKCV